MTSSLDHATTEPAQDLVSNRVSRAFVEAHGKDSSPCWELPGDKPRSTSASVASVAWLAGRGLGALAVLAMGAVHLHEYLGPYSAIRTIGTLFLLNFVGSTVIGLLLLAPLEHLSGRWAGTAVAVVTLSGIALAATSLVSLAISERMPLFGFEERGYDPTGIVVSRQVEIAAVVLLGVSLVARFANKAAEAPVVTENHLSAPHTKERSP